MLKVDRCCFFWGVGPIKLCRVTLHELYLCKLRKFLYKGRLPWIIHLKSSQMWLKLQG